MSPQQAVVVELSHQINSPLAVIRNVLYLAALKTPDAETCRYLQLAEEAVCTIAESLRQARVEADAGRPVHGVPRIHKAAA